MSIRVYSPKKVAVDIAGVSVEGYSDGTFIEANRNTPNTTQVVGADGKVGLSYSADNTGTVTLTLQQNSPTNLMLSAIQNLQDVRQTVLRFPISVMDPSGGFLMVATNCHILQAPPASLGAELESKSWEFYVEDLRYTETPEGLSVDPTAAAAISVALASIDANGLNPFAPVA